MSGPWEKFQQQPAEQEQDGPWKKFAAAPAPAASGGIADLIRGTPAPLSRTDKFLKGVMDPVEGASQLANKILPNGVVQTGIDAYNWLADKGVVSKPKSGTIDQQIRDREAEYQARRKAQGESGFDGWRTTGNVVSPANMALGVGGTGATLAGRIALGAARGAASGALQPATSADDFWAEKGRQVATGAVVGGALPPIFGAAARIVSPNASKNAALQLLKDEGVRPTIGQALGGAANRAEEKLQSLPIVGDAITGARRGAQEGFEAAAHNRALKPIGQELPAGLTGRDAVTYTENALKSKYDEVLTKIGAVRADPAFNTQVSNLHGMVQRLMMPQAEKMKFQSALNDVMSSMDRNGVITSDAYKALESSLSSDARKLAGSQNIYEGKLAPAVQQLKGELQDLLRRQAGGSADDLRAVNAGWANFKRVQNASSKLGAEDGQFTPAQFQNAVRALDKSKDKGAFARGSALGQDLSDAGKTVLGSKVPNSGTADRAFLSGGLVGMSAKLGALPALLGGAGMYLSPAQRALVAAASARPASAQPAAQAIKKISPMFIPGLTQLSLDELK